MGRVATPWRIRHKTTALKQATHSFPNPRGERDNLCRVTRKEEVVRRSGRTPPYGVTSGSLRENTSASKRGKGGGGERERNFSNPKLELGQKKKEQKHKKDLGRRAMFEG